LADEVGSSELAFVSGLGVAAQVQRVAPPAWQDVYQLADFVLADLGAQEEWGAGDQEAARFTVKLRLAPSHTVRDPLLWLLPSSAQPRVERLLHAIPEPDLDSLQFTFQEDARGEGFLLLRERHTGTGGEHIDFEGVRLAPYAGYPNLLLPVDMELEPLLRKDRYRHIFALKPGQWTLLWQDKGKLRLVQVAERSFRPLTEMVDYIIGLGADALEAVVSRSVFHFQDFRHAAPAHAPARQERGPKRTPGVQDEWAVEPGAEPQAKAKVGPEEAEVQVPIAAPQAVRVEPTQNQLELQQAAMETEIILKGQSPERWIVLGDLKAQAGLHRDAAHCWAEALWLVRDPAQADALEARLIESLERDPDINLRGAAPDARAKKLGEEVQRAGNDPAWVWLWVLHGARYARKHPGQMPPQQLHQWLQRSNQVLENRAEELRKKEQWLLWGQILRLNQDAVAEAKVRELITRELNSRGMRPQDVPQFIQNRIYRSRLIDEADEDVSEELRAARGIVEMIEEHLGRATDEPLKRITRAVLAYGYERLGDKVRSLDRFEEAERHFQNVEPLKNADRAWIALYLGAALEAGQAGAGALWLDAYDRLQKQQKFEGLNGSELAALHKGLLQRVGSESPSSFLSAEKFRALYPEPQKYVQAQNLRNELEQLIQKGEFASVLRLLQSMADRAAKNQLVPSSRDSAWLLGPIVAALHRTGHAAEGAELLHRFEAAAPDPALDQMSGFYPILYRIKLAEGFMDLGEERHGMELVCQSIRLGWVGERRLQWLDHLDMLSAALQAIASAPMQNRREGVEQVLEALFLDRPHPSNADNEQYRPVKLRLLDHCVEVGLSKEKLSLRRYKHYLDEDEFHIRQRIVQERPTQPA
jgi:hypothetical protein